VPPVAGPAFPGTRRRREPRRPGPRRWQPGRRRDGQPV